MTAAAASTPAAVPPAPLTLRDAASWVLRNLAVLMGAFYPAVVLLVMAVTCLDESAGACDASLVLGLPFVWLWFALPALLLGGAPLLVILPVALWHRGVARALAVLIPLAVVAREAPYAGVEPHMVPVLALCVACYGFMPRLDPRQRLREAMWVWWVPAALAGLNVALALAGTV